MTAFPSSELLFGYHMPNLTFPDSPAAVPA
jgi:hypothetical protein